MEITKQILASSLKKLMDKKHLQEITVREIAELSGVHRQTFYYHFQSIYDLLIWMFSTDLADVFSNNQGGKTWKTKFSELFAYLEKNRTVCICALKSLGRETLRDTLHEDLLSVIREIVESHEISQILDVKQITFITEFYLHATAGLVEDWLLGHITLTSEEIVSMIESSARHQISGVAGELKKNMEI